MYCILRNIQVLAIQEHRLVIKDTDEQFIRLRLSFGWWFIYSSATLTSNNVPVGGVGFFLSPTANKNICSINKVSDRILLIRFGSNSDFKTSVICVYSPTSTSNVDDIEQFYADLSQAVQPINLSTLLIILGDFNAKLIANKSQQYTCNLKPNRNTEYLDTFIAENQFRPVNMLFQKPNNFDMYLFMDPRNVKFV